MTHKERLADIKRIRDDVEFGVHDFDHTDVEGLLAELDRRQARLAKYVNSHDDLLAAARIGLIYMEAADGTDGDFAVVHAAIEQAEVML